MKLLLASSVLLASLLGLAAAAAPRAQDAGFPQPGPQHVLLQKTAGTWDAAVYMMGSDKPSKGTLTRTKLAGFHTFDSFEGDVMGTKFVGHGMNGYCPIRKQFFGYWTDSMTPTPMTVQGDYDEKKRELTMEGECFGMSGQLEKCRTVAHFVDDDHMDWAMYGAGPDGKDMQHLRIEYTRRK